MTVVIIGVSLSFIRPNEFLMEDDCNGQTQLFLIIVWLGFVIPYFCYLRTFFVLSDPYQVLLKLKIETVACIVVGVLSIVWAIYHESVSESHSALIYNKLFWITQMSFWYAESYIPLKLTQERIRENKLGKSLDGPTLLETLSDARLLRRFAQHLIKEWSIENLDFLKASLLHQFETTRTVSRILKLYKKLGKIGSADKEVAALEFTRRVGIRVMTKSWKIYNTYIADTATTQVTLGNAITSAIHRYFEKDCFFDIRLNEEDVDSTSSRVFESKILESNRARNGGVPRTPDRKIARKDKPESGVVGAEEKTTIHKFQTIGRVSKDDEDSIPTVKPFLSAKRSSNDPNHVERVELRDLVIDMGRRQVTTDTTISKDITMSEKSRHFTIDTTMSKDMNMSEMTVDTLDRHKRPVKKSSRAHPTWVSQQLILEKNESKNIGSENTTPKSSRTNSGKSQQGRIDTSWNPTDCKRDVASPRSVESSRTNSPSRSRSIHKHIRPHDLKAFCAVISTASMEDFDNSSVCAELGETVAALRKLLSMKSQMDAKEALERGAKRFNQNGNYADMHGHDGVLANIRCSHKIRFPLVGNGFSQALRPEAAQRFEKVTSWFMSLLCGMNFSALAFSRTWPIFNTNEEAKACTFH
eukprot:CAMPEP_0114509030 /NCGR_PEP_ID=MMETSP0109-20121206/12970_1 /TAXON_ID=29199 /ORGANISM="Chlorarachnion reptans, Strain CCCM449" /LENGTH=640 /DNA_ID=CAMNT_0001688111 /DNA_START=438 /DNA_END=2359 /DNA_ORIENTATION=+